LTPVYLATPYSYNTRFSLYKLRTVHNNEPRTISRLRDGRGSRKRQALFWRLLLSVRCIM